MKHAVFKTITSRIPIFGGEGNSATLHSSRERHPQIVICASLFFLKFLLFDLLWCIPTTFSSFSYPTTYISKIFLSLCLAAPLALRMPKATVIALAAATDLWLVANLLYFRTYFTVIPAESYLLIGNLRDFTDSVVASLRWYDVIFPLTTAAMPYVLRTTARRPSHRWLVRYFSATAAAALSLLLLTLPAGGFRKSYAGMLVHRQMSATPTYSIFGTLIYNALDETPKMTPSRIAEIDEFIDGNRPDILVDAPVPHDIAVLILESFESWVLERSVEGKELTPNLNRLLREKRTLYAPHVQSQVKGGRSIDAQLLITAGLLPIDDGCFSARYPYSTYKTIVHALRESRPDTRAYAFTPDKATTWNQMIVARQFGFDRLFDRSEFSRDELTGHGNHKRIADAPFLAECMDKLETLAAEKDCPRYIQCITFSGHTPFVIPEHLRRISFSNAVPQLMADYMTAANYTDSAIGAFIERLRNHPQFRDAVIVITGDHEGLASDRAALAKSDAGRGIVSENCFTPLIVLNSPVAMRYEAVMGQADIHPTLLDLFGLGNRRWRGVGHSILQPDAPHAAIDSTGETVGNPEDSNTVQRLREAWRISDVIIRGDYFAAKNGKGAKNSGKTRE